MKRIVMIAITAVLSACSVAIPIKPTAGTVWHLRPEPVAVAEERKPIGIVVAKPWMASGYDTNQVVISLEGGERDVLADVVWSDTHGEWIRNYFIEALQSTGQFSAVTGNQSLQDRLLFVRLFIWDFSVHYPADTAAGNPLVKAKFAVNLTNGRGQKLMDQQVIEVEYQASENRLEPIMNGFRQVINESFKQTLGLINQL